MLFDATIYPEPFRYMVCQKVFGDQSYRAALNAWPSMLPGVGRTGHDLMPGDPGYSALRTVGPWAGILKALYDVQCQQLLHSFGERYRWMQDVDGPEAELIEYLEPRGHVQLAELPEADRLPPEKLFVRVDFQEGGVGYQKPKHVDWRRRLISGVIFFCDAQEQGFEGGDFQIFDAQGNVAASFAPAHNLGIFWLSSNDSYHAGQRLTAIKSGTRRWLYFAISSTQTIW